MAGLTWEHTEDIALSLFEARPETDPTQIRYTDLHKWITELPNFKDDPAASTEGSWKPFKWHGLKSIKTTKAAEKTIRYVRIIW